MILSRPYVPDPDTYVEIGAVERTRQAILSAMKSPFPSYIVSPPGYGKTTALYYLSQEYGGDYCQ
ncbi:hypothetical protein, partial [Pseudovibrio sp. POLY-S9]|uniref:hypothetical protein n=1 Tax=Pseudovibrio sp. POLY-S9 TaxID=1576596 RepID=UPI001AD94D20